MTSPCLIMAGDTDGAEPASEPEEMKHDDILGEAVQEVEAVFLRHTVMKLVGWCPFTEVLQLREFHPDLSYRVHW